MDVRVVRTGHRAYESPRIFLVGTGYAMISRRGTGVHRSKTQPGSKNRKNFARAGVQKKTPRRRTLGCRGGRSQNRDSGWAWARVWWTRSGRGRHPDRAANINGRSVGIILALSVPILCSPFVRHRIAELINIGTTPTLVGEIDEIS